MNWEWKRSKIRKKEKKGKVSPEGTRRETEPSFLFLHLSSSSLLFFSPPFLVHPSSHSCFVAFFLLCGLLFLAFSSVRTFDVRGILFNLVGLPSCCWYNNEHLKEKHICSLFILHLFFFSWFSFSFFPLSFLFLADFWSHWSSDFGNESLLSLLFLLDVSFFLHSFPTPPHPDFSTAATFRNKWWNVRKQSSPEIFYGMETQHISFPVPFFSQNLFFCFSVTFLLVSFSPPTTEPLSLSAQNVFGDILNNTTGEWRRDGCEKKVWTVNCVLVFGTWFTKGGWKRPWGMEKMDSNREGEREKWRSPSNEAVGANDRRNSRKRGNKKLKAQSMSSFFKFITVEL